MTKRLTVGLIAAVAVLGGAAAVAQWGGTSQGEVDGAAAESELNQAWADFDAAREALVEDVKEAEEHGSQLTEEELLARAREIWEAASKACDLDPEQERCT